MRPSASDNRLSLLIQLNDRPGALEEALSVFSHHKVNLTHIESRPARGESFDFYVDCEGRRGVPKVDAVLADLSAKGATVFLLDDKEVPWFPRHISELNRIASNTLDAGDDLQSDHPGFNDKDYRDRRAHIDSLARAYRFGNPVPNVEYTESETATWKEIFDSLTPLHEKFACAEYKHAFSSMQVECDLSNRRIPDAASIDKFLATRTGFHLWPVAGLLSARDFLAGLAFRVFFSTQYIRHHSLPLYTPEPDVCHELIGHAPMFADAAFADLSQEIGLASLGASDSEIEQLARCYWFSVEFGLVGQDNSVKAYGAGLLSSFGELEYACLGDSAEQRIFDPKEAARTDYPITEYQPIYFLAPGLHEAKVAMREYCRNLARPFYARYNPTTQRIWVDRALRVKR